MPQRASARRRCRASRTRPRRRVPPRRDDRLFLPAPLGGMGQVAVEMSLVMDDGPTDVSAHAGGHARIDDPAHRHRPAAGPGSERCGRRRRRSTGSASRFGIRASRPGGGFQQTADLDVLERRRPVARSQIGVRAVPPEGRRQEAQVEAAAQQRDAGAPWRGCGRSVAMGAMLPPAGRSPRVAVERCGQARAEPARAPIRQNYRLRRLPRPRLVNGRREPAGEVHGRSHRSQMPSKRNWPTSLEREAGQ